MPHELSGNGSSETSFQDREEIFESLFAAMREGVAVQELVYDGTGQVIDYRILDVNPSFEGLVGVPRTRLIGMSGSELYHSGPPPFLTTYARVAASGELLTFEGAFEALQKVFRVCAFSPGPGRVATIIEDVTERRRLEEQFRQAQKMESMGRLAGAVAHDFNNLLTAILGYSELILDELDREDPIRADLEEIRRAGESAASLTRQLLAFTRRRYAQPLTVDLNQTVAGLDRLLRRVLGSNVELVTQLDPELGGIHADAGHLDQIIVNLAINALDAMPAGGRLVIGTRNVWVPDDDQSPEPEIPPGRYVCLSVTDTGSGMDETTRARIFEPFFTTKPAERGTGLGLPTIRSIVQGYGGVMGTVSQPGHGTEVRIYLPTCVDPIDPPTPNPPIRATETILIVEDQPVVKALAEETLRRAGYQVLAAGTWDEALALAERHRGDIDLALVDVVMPDLSGGALVQRMRASRRDAKVVLMSGYTEPVRDEEDLTQNAMTFLQKPFTPSRLLEVVRRTLSDG